MIPIHRDNGAIIAFGGRAMDAWQQPKYLNSPETPIYTKGRTLYGLHVSKALIRQVGFAVLVEGYFDFGQVFQVGYPAVASSGTALTPEQARQLLRFTKKVVLSFDPDTAGQGAAAKSSEMLVAEGFEVNVALLPKGDDPDTFVRKHGRAGYGERLRQSQPYLEYLLDRAAAGHNLNTDEGRVKFLGDMMPVASRIPDAAMRDRFADRLAHKAQVTDEVIRAEIRKAAVHRQISVPRQAKPTLGTVIQAEKGLIWLLVHRPDSALDVLAQLEPADVEALTSRSVLDLALELKENSGFSPATFFQRLTQSEAELVTRIAAEPEDATWAVEFCVRQLRRNRLERERTALRQEIERVQRSGGTDVNALLTRIGELGRMIQALAIAEE